MTVDPVEIFEAKLNVRMMDKLSSVNCKKKENTNLILKCVSAYYRRTVL